MTIEITHPFTNPKADGPDDTIVRPSNWNEAHAITMASGFVIGRTTAGAGAAEEVAIGTGAGEVAPGDHDHAGVYEPADATILKDADIGSSVQAHSAVLDGTTASFTTTLENKLDGVEEGATANDTDANLLSRSNHTGTQPLSTISDSGGAAALDVGTTAGTVAAGNDSRFHTPVSLAGTPNYLTISGQTITRALVSLANHITGTLGLSNGGTGATTASGARSNLNVPGLNVSNTFADGTSQEVGTFSGSGSTFGQRLGIGSTPHRRDSSVTVTSTASHNGFWNPNGSVGGISTEGSATNFNTSSDGELKDAIADADKAASIAQIKAGRPVEFEFKTERGVKHLGFIAQEMHEVFPDAVTPGDEDTPWMMDHSKLVPVLWVGVQYHEDRIEELEATVTAQQAAIEGFSDRIEKLERKE